MIPDIKQLIRPIVTNLVSNAWKLKNKEMLLIVTDYPSNEELPELKISLLESMIQRALLARVFHEIVSENFPNQSVLYYFKPTYKHYKTPEDQILLKQIKKCDVLLSLTEYSLTDIPPIKELLDKKKIRHISAPLIQTEAMLPEGPCDVDYYKIEEISVRLFELLTTAEKIEIKDFMGSSIIIEEHKESNWLYETGLVTEPGMMSNLPAGEVVLEVDEKGYKPARINGTVNIFPGWQEDLTENLHLLIKDNVIVDLSGGGKAGEHLKALIQRNKVKVVQIGIGTNPNARDPLCPTIADKFIGMAHIALTPKAEVRHFYIPVSQITVDGKTYQRLELFENVLGLEM